MSPLKNFALALAAAAALVPAPSRADPGATDRPRTLRRALEEVRHSWISSAESFVGMGENLHFDKKAGLAYRHEMRLGNRSVELRLKGPVVRKKKGLGLTLVVRF